MTKHKIKGLVITWLPSVAVATVLAAPALSVAQNQTPAPAQERVASEPVYKPPPRGALGGGSAARPAGR